MTQAIEPSSSIDDRTDDHPVASPRVFAVIPVHNRLPLTLGCLEQLKRQTYRPITAIVVDGGSDDDTVQTLRGDHPDVVLLTSPEPLFWAGATRLGIDWVLERADAQDFVLLLNNDTTFGADYVEKLIDISLREDAAVGGVNVDSRDMTTPINAGVRIDWQGYDFSPCRPTPNADPFNDQVDVLNGRGVLVPLAMIEKAGNVDDQVFPHYIADYDFFCRLRRAGFRLGIHQQARIGMMVAETGLDPESQDRSFTDWARSLFDRRSRHNLVDHWRFVTRHAPPGHRPRLKFLLLKRCLGQLLNVVVPPRSRLGRINRLLRRAAGSVPENRREPFHHRQGGR